MSESVCRWGFLGTAAISRKVWKAIRVSGNGRVVAVASRSAARAQEYIDQCSAEVPAAAAQEPVLAIESYQALLDRDDIDAVYIPLPTGLRAAWVIAAAKAGKHVLCEKPAAVHTDDLQAMIDACTAGGVQFMDGVMFDHSERMREIHRSLRDDSPIGTLRRINSHFSFRGDDTFQQSNIRTNAQLEPHGALGDLGWYCIRFTLWAANFAMPTHVRGQTLTALRGSDSEAEVPGEFTGEMRFADGLTASFYCSFLTANQQTATVSGDGGYVTVDDFVLPFYGAESSWRESHNVLSIDNCRWNFSEHTTRKSVVEFSSGESNAQEVNMVRRLAQAALSNTVDTFYPELTIKTQKILDACRRSDASAGKWIAP
ncbi:1,5-anhydro-D-fructose reductase [Rubripirellula tenax]|uniref:1,5-anhydro-D-fructose reductase n=1 Tax=Rubripirellula tenax TaxID=2528015 RepID=A0A5C6FEQ1_9BACT|nr:Gfo/Idh/MocA family oxidoreductase [Rubripirellula tenax]TWU59868.1 1,5-anhydro-D-fructose reductase [Rubripirellula tenax]